MVAKTQKQNLTFLKKKNKQQYKSNIYYFDGDYHVINYLLIQEHCKLLFFNWD